MTAIPPLSLNSNNLLFQRFELSFQTFGCFLCLVGIFSLPLDNVQGFLEVACKRF